MSKEKRHQNRSPVRTVLESILTWSVTAITVVGCTTNGVSKPSSLSVVEFGDAFLTVINRHPHHVKISIQPLHGSILHLGSSRVQDTREFRLPRTLNGVPARVIIRCLETDELRESRDIVWGPADRFSLTVADMLAFSSIARNER